MQTTKSPAIAKITERGLSVTLKFIQGR